MPTTSTTLSSEAIAYRILLIRGHKVIIDADLADLYSVTTKRLNEQIKRNSTRFPTDFVFQLTKAEKSKVVADCDHLAKLKFSSTNPYAFTEHGAIMAASVLNSPKAVEVSVLVVRTFVTLRQMLSNHTELRHKLAALEARLDNHDETIYTLVQTIRQLMERPKLDKNPPIGFAPWPDDHKKP